MFNQMRFFKKIKFGSIPVSIENCQNIVTSGRKWRSRNTKFACSLWRAYLVQSVRPSKTHKKYDQHLNDFLSGNELVCFFFVLFLFLFFVFVCLFGFCFCFVLFFCFLFCFCFVLFCFICSQTHDFYFEISKFNVYCKTSTVQGLITRFS